MDFVPLIGVGIGAVLAGAAAGAVAAIRLRLDERYRHTRIFCQDLILEAKNEALALRREAQSDLDGLRAEADMETRARRADLQRLECKLAQREEMLDEQSAQVRAREERLIAKEQMLECERRELTLLQERRHTQLQDEAGLTPDEARALLMREIEDDARREAALLVRRIEEEAKREADRRARSIVTCAIQRLAVQRVAETTVSVVSLPSDDVKGRIIGREGRNIRAFETLTGVDVIIDDTPEAVVLSSFDPVRREVARRALTQLILDGRIHPGRIEELVARAQDEVEASILEAGEQAVLDAKVLGLHPELIKLIGRMRYRFSYGQNLLAHSVEVSQIGAALASELGVDVGLVRRACLLHDLGKIVPDAEGPHALISRDVALRFGESAEVAHAAGAHHDDLPHERVEDTLVQLADSVSASRPGARREVLETYLRRLEKLEAIACSFPGVERTYAVQAGREVRLIVRPELVDDAAARRLVCEIARRIEQEIDFPGQIKVTAIRETRAIDFAT